MDDFSSLKLNKLVVCPALIGRTACLDTIEEAILQTTTGAGRLLLFSGEAGVGKSRLVATAKTKANGLNWLVLEGHCFDSDYSFPYDPLIDLLRTFFTPFNRETVLEALGIHGPQLVKILPELSTYLPELVPSPVLVPEVEKRQLFEALTQFILRQAASQPLLFIIEDLHWCDQTSLEFLLQLARRLVNYPALIVLTCRNEANSPELTYFLASLERERLITELVLAPLNLREVEAMLEVIFELHEPVPAEFLTTLYNLTEGNPFFIEEILKALITKGEIFYASGVWDRKPLIEMHIPRSLQAAVTQRLACLSEPAREILLLAAVLGQQFDFELLMSLTQLTEATLLDLLKELIAAQMLTELSVEKLAFRHTLTRHIIYQQLLARERRAFHLKIALAIEQLYATNLSLHLADLAQHFYQAGEWLKAITYARPLGEKSLALNAPQSIIEQYNRIIEATRQLGGSPAEQDYLRRGHAYEMLGQFEAAQIDYEVAQAAANETHNQPAEIEALLALGLLWAARDYSLTGNFYRQALELARQLNDPAMLAHCLNRLGNWHANMEQPLQGLEFHQEAMTLFEEIKNQSGRAETFDLLGLASLMGGNFVQSAVFYEQAIKLFQELNNLLNNLRSLASSLAFLPILAGSYHSADLRPAPLSLNEAEQAGETSLQLARQINWRSGEAFALYGLCFCLGYHGSYTKALAYAESSLKIAKEIGHNQWLTSANCALGMLYYDLLDLKTAQPYLEEALTQAKRLNSAYWMHNTGGFLASLYTRSGQTNRAEETLQEVLTPDMPTETLGQRIAWQARAELDLRKGEPEKAWQILERMDAFSPPSLPNGLVEATIPTLLKAEVLLALDRTEEAEAMLIAARNEMQTQGVPSLVWRIEISLAQLYLKQKRNAAANEAITSAETIITELAAALEDEELQRNFQREALALIPTAPALSSSQAMRQTRAGLTARERDVALLVAQGKSNREIAAELVLNKRTVESYLEHIFSKLNLTSRVQLAAWTIEKGWLKPDE